MTQVNGRSGRQVSMETNIRRLIRPIFTARVWIALLLMGMVIHLGQTRQPATAQATAQPNVIFIVVDALRADHVSAYGYERPTTPRLDAFMAEGVRFAEATSPSSWTFPSNVTMFTGRMPQRIRMNDWGSFNAVIPSEEMTLGQAMKNGGYLTAGFVTNYYLDSKFGFARGFDHYQRLTKTELAEDLNGLIFDWLDTNPPASDSRPLFLFAYYYDPHSWYDPPPPYDTLYKPGCPSALTPESYGHGERVVAGEDVLTACDVEHLLALYDGETTYWDYHLGQFLDRLEAEGLLDNALIVLTSDHGQMFGEHGKWVHRNSLYEEVLRVPLFIHYPGTAPAGMVVDTPVFTADIMPTILDLAGLPIPPKMDGKSLRPFLEGQRGALLNRPIFAEMEAEPSPSSPGHWIAPPYSLRSIKIGGWKYVKEINNPAGDALYQVQADSIYEGVNMRGDYPQKAQELHDTLFDWFRLPTDFLFFPSVRYR